MSSQYKAGWLTQNILYYVEIPAMCMTIRTTYQIKDFHHVLKVNRLLVAMYE